ncbi:MAG: hypothetical protein ABIH23_01910 [bacterium]
MPLTAYQIDTVDDGAFVFSGSPCGPYQFGSNLYIAQQSDGASYWSMVWKSSDNGQTWAPQDEANAPTAIGSIVSYYPGAGDTLYLSYKKSGTQQIYVCTFSMVSDLYGTSIGPAPISPSTQVNRPVGVYYSGGVWKVLYACVSPSSLRVATWDGSSWTSSDAATYHRPLMMRPDSSGILHVFADTPNSPFYYYKLKTNGTWVDAIRLKDDISAEDIDDEIGWPSFIGTQLVLPGCKGTGASRTPALLIIDDYLEDAPAMTLVQVDTSFATEVQTEYYSGIINVWWMKDSFDPAGSMMSAEYNGTTVSNIQTRYTVDLYVNFAYLQPPVSISGVECVIAAPNYISYYFTTPAGAGRNYAFWGRGAIGSPGGPNVGIFGD